MSWRLDLQMPAKQTHLYISIASLCRYQKCVLYISTCLFVSSIHNVDFFDVTIALSHTPASISYTSGYVSWP